MRLRTVSGGYFVCLQSDVRVWWQGLGETQRQARELILGPHLGARARFLSFNRTQSRVVTGLLTGHNTLEETSSSNGAVRQSIV